jgi:predicted O-methyltransferase YrrM
MRNSESDKNQYLNTLYGNECDILKQIRASAPEDKAHMQIHPFEGDIITFFANLINAKIIIEIGTFVGYSAAYMALKLNSPDLVVYSIEKNPDYFKIAKNNIHARVMHKMQYILALRAGPTIWLNILNGLMLNSNLPSGCGNCGE